jgi:hypothetical protein
MSTAGVRENLKVHRYLLLCIRKSCFGATFEQHKDGSELVSATEAETWIEFAAASQADARSNFTKMTSAPKMARFFSPKRELSPPITSSAAEKPAARNKEKISVTACPNQKP